MPIKLEKVEDAALNMIVYGLSGVGKTILLATAQQYPPTSPTLLIDIDRGTMSLKGRVARELGIKGVDITRPRNFHDLQEVYNDLRHGRTKYKSVGLDGLTEFNKRLSMNKVMNLTDESDGYAHLAASVPPRQQDWLKMNHQLSKIIRAFRDLAYLEPKSRRIHVFMTALEKRDDDEMVVCPDLQGKLGLGCGGLVDVLCRLYTVEVTDKKGKEIKKRRLLTTSRTDDTGMEYLAKNRGDLPRRMDEPTIGKIVGILCPWLSDKEEEED